MSVLIEMLLISAGMLLVWWTTLQFCMRDLDGRRFKDSILPDNKLQRTCTWEFQLYCSCAH